MNEKQAIMLLKEDSHEAYTLLYNMYWDKVYNFSRLYVSSIEDAKEIVQTVFVKLWETRSFLKEDENFKGYLFIITRNIIFNLQKKCFNEFFYKTSILKAFSEQNIEDAYGEETLYASELKLYIDHLIETLPSRQREAFLLSRTEGLTYKEIAERIGISEKTVEIHIAKALKYLRKNIVLLILFVSC